MCGINGITDNNRTIVERMNAATQSRGPDDSNIRTFQSCTLGHNRLSIIDVSDRSSQPMSTADGRYTIVFNGEIYNFLELKKELEQAYTFTSAGDTEVLLAGYVQWGKDVLHRVRGIFACAIWDEQEQVLFAARDHMGVKPLYYAADGRTLTFSSELKGMLAARSTRMMDMHSFALFLAIQYVPSPNTLVSGISKLPPGHYLTFKNGSLSVVRYYISAAPQAGKSPHDLYTTIDSSVQRQLVSDRPLGVFLSGGLDSSIILHHVKNHVVEPRTFSVEFEMTRGFENETEKFNADARLAEHTSKHYKTKHTTYAISITNVRDVITEHLAEFDEPIANPTAVSQYLLSKFVRNDVVVALSGDGGDELFGGYPRHTLIRLADVYQRLPRALRTLASPLHSRLRKLDVPLGPLQHSALMARDITILNRIIKQPIEQSVLTDFFSAQYDRYSTLSPVEAYMRVDRETWLSDEALMRLDKVSMAHGLEVRVPLLDMDVVRYADSLTAAQKFSLHESKKVLKQLYRQHLPGHLFNQPKRGWISPGAKWLRDEKIAPYVAEVLSEGYYAGLSKVIDFEAVRTMHEDHIAQRGYYLLPLWNLLILQIWAKKYHVSV